MMSPLMRSDLLAYWVHTPHPFLIQFTETIGIRYYGLSYVLGFVGAAWLMQRYAKAGKSLLPEAKVWDFIVVLVIGVMLGGRLGSFLLYNPGQLFRQPLDFFRVWEGGMASHGGFVGVTVATWWYARRHKLPLLHLADLAVSAGPLGLMLGRIANFINGELWGHPTDVPWAVIFSESPLPLVPRHPSQLYEAALEGALLLAYGQWRFWRTKGPQLHPGRLTGEFLVGYAIARVICEQFREPDFGVSPIWGMNRGAFYSLFMAAAGLLVIAISLRQPPLSASHPETKRS